MIPEDILKEAMNDAWNDFCVDTCCYPDCFSVKRNKLSADFRKGNFVEIIISILNRLLVKNNYTICKINNFEKNKPKNDTVCLCTTEDAVMSYMIMRYLDHKWVNELGRVIANSDDHYVISWIAVSEIFKRIEKEKIDDL